MKNSKISLLIAAVAAVGTYFILKKISSRSAAVSDQILTGSSGSQPVNIFLTPSNIPLFENKAGAVQVQVVVEPETRPEPVKTTTKKYRAVRRSSSGSITAIQEKSTGKVYTGKVVNTAALKNTFLGVRTIKN